MFVLVARVHIPRQSSCDLTDDDKDVAVQTDTVRWQGSVEYMLLNKWQVVGFSHHGVPSAAAAYNCVALFIRSEGTSQ